MNDTDKMIKALENAGKPLKPGEIADLSGLEKSMVDKLIKQLKKEDMIESPKRCYYSLKQK